MSFLAAAAVTAGAPEDYEMVSPLSAGESVLYTWDYANRLTSAFGTSYNFDYLGRRSSAITAGTTTKLINLGPHTIGERAGTTITARDYIFGPGLDEPLAKIENGAFSFYAADGLGSVVASSDASGAVLGAVTYDPWGVQSQLQGNVGLFGFTGRESAGGLWYLRARYYDPSIGRFISEDPLSPSNAVRVALASPSMPPDPAVIGSRMHRYVYAQNSPMLYKDPMESKPRLVFAINKVSDYVPAGPPGKTFKGCQYIGRCGNYLSVYDVDVPLGCPCKDMCIINIDYATGIPVGPSICFTVPPVVYSPPPIPPVFVK